MAAYAPANATGKKSLVELRRMLLQEVPEADVTQSFDRPINFNTNELFTTTRTVDFNHSLDALASDPSLRVWRSNDAQRFLRDGDKIVATKVCVIGMRNSSRVPLGIKFTNLDVNRPQIVGHRYKNSNVDVMLQPKSDQSVKRTLYKAPIDSVNAALHPNTINNHLANMSEESLRGGIVDENEEFDAFIIKSDTLLGSEINALFLANRIDVGDNFQAIPSTNPNGPSLLIVNRDLTNRVVDHLLTERKKLPFRDPSAVTAELIRLDGEDFNSTGGLIDQDTPMENLQMETESRKLNQISVDIEEQYLVARAAQ